MKQVLMSILALVGAVSLVAGGVFLWNNRPGRTAVSVNGRVLTERELLWRAQTLIDDAKRMESLLIPEREMPAAILHYRRLAAKMWIVKEVLLSAAVEAGVKVTPADEKDSLEKAQKQLESRHLTTEQYFKEGPIPEAVKRSDFREALLIGKYTKQEFASNSPVSAKEVDERIKELRAENARIKRDGGAEKFKTDRKSVINMIQQENYNKNFKKLFREKFVKMDVSCPAFPDLENVDAVSPVK